MARPGTFKPGTSGNPGGRPKGAAELEALSRQHAPAAIRALVKALDDERLCVQAAAALLDRGFGRPAQTLNANVSFLDGLSTTELGSLEASLSALAGDTGETAERGATTH